MLAVTLPPNLDNSFSLTGEFLGFAHLDGYKLKYLRMRCDGQVYLIKIPKEQRLNLYKTLTPGMQITCQGECKPDKSGAGMKYKATVITAVAQLSKGEAKVKVLVCGKSDCRERGSELVAQAFQANPHFQVQMTGCQKQCKQAPNVMVSAPHYKQRYSRLRLRDVPLIIQEILRRSEGSHQPTETGTSDRDGAIICTTQ